MSDNKEEKTCFNSRMPPDEIGLPVIGSTGIGLCSSLVLKYNPSIPSFPSFPSFEILVPDISFSSKGGIYKSLSGSSDPLAKLTRPPLAKFNSS
jgi:hypothetical protein